MPGYTNDAQTLADIVSPAAAASQAGVQNEQNNEAEAIKNQVSQLTEPAQVNEPYLKNLFTQAQTGETNAIAQKYGLENQLAQGTLGSDIAAKNSGNQLKLTQDQEQKMVAVSQIATNAAAYLDSVSPEKRPQVMDQLLRSNNIDPQQVGPLASGDPDMLRMVGQKLFDASNAARMERLKGGQEASKAMGVATIEQTGHIQAAKEQADARRYYADTQERIRQATAGLGALQQQLYTKVANGTATDQERAALNSINQVQQLAKAGDPFQASITGTNVQPNVPAVPGVPAVAPSNNIPQINSPQSNNSNIPPELANMSYDQLLAIAKQRGLVK